MVAADDVASSGQRHRLGLVVGLLTALLQREWHERHRIVEHEFRTSLSVRSRNPSAGPTRRTAILIAASSATALSIMALAANRAPERNRRRAGRSPANPRNGPASRSPAGALGRPRGGFRRSADKRVRLRASGESTWRLRILVLHTCRDSLKEFNGNLSQTWHYRSVASDPSTPAISMAYVTSPAQSVEDGLEASCVSSAAEVFLDIANVEQ